MNNEGIRKQELGVCGRFCKDFPNAGSSYSRLLAVKIRYTHTHKCRISLDEITLYGKENYLPE